MNLAAAMAVALLAATGHRAPATDGPLPVAGRRSPVVEPPTLVVAITIDQFRGDYLDKYGPVLTAGFARLAREGAVFTRAYQDHGLTETAPGHAAVLSGRYPASTGIVINAAGVGDTSMPTLGVRGGASPRRFQGTTLVDWLQARWRGSRALSISWKDRGAILPIGRAREQVYWYAGGTITSSRWYMDTLPSWVQAFNAEARAVRPPAEWTLARPEADYPEPDDQPWENRGRNRVFPHTMGSDTGGMLSASYGRPWGDSLALAFALRGLETLDLGRGPHTDVLAIGLSSMDFIGHGYGPDSREVRDLMFRLDGWLGTFLDSLDRLRDPRRVVLVLTADHGISPVPDRFWSEGDASAHWVDPDSLLRSRRLELGRATGTGILWWDVGVVAIDREGLRRRRVDPDTVIASLQRDLAALPGVTRVLTAPQVLAADTTRDDFARRFQRMLAPGAGLELFVDIGPRSAWGSGVAQHGQPSELDAHVVLLLRGAGVRPGRYDAKAAVVDIAPTLARLIGVRPAERVDGRVLTEALVGDR